MKQQLPWWWQPPVLVSLFGNKMKGRGLWMWEAERLRGVKWRHTVTGPEYCSYNNHYPGQEETGGDIMFRLWSNNVGCEVRLGWVRVTESVPASICNISPLSLCGDSLSLSLSLSVSVAKSPVFMTQRTHGPLCPPWSESHQCCGHSLHNCHPLIMTSGDTFHRLGHLNQKSIRYMLENCDIAITMSFSISMSSDSDVWGI